MILFGSCARGGSAATDADTSVNKKAQIQLSNPVDTITLRRGTFRSQFISTGKLRAQQKSDLRSIVSGTEGEYYPLHLDLSDKEVPATMSTVRDAVERDNNFEVSFSGSWFDSRDTLKQLIMVLTVSLLLLYFILASQFESLVQPFIIMSEIVVDISGALLVLWVCGATINLMSLIGLVVMSGIVINDYNIFRHGGDAPASALI